MNRQVSFIGLALLGSALAGCGEEDASGNQAAAESAGAAGESTAESTAGSADDEVGGEAPADDATGGEPAETPTGDDSGEVSPSEEVAPPEPFVLEFDLCRPNFIEAPEPIHDPGHFNATISSVTGWGDEVFFAESASFDEIPPRIARVRPDGTVETLLDGAVTHLEVFGDTLYYIGAGAFSSLDLSTPGAAPQVVMEISGLVAHDETTVLYSDDNDAVWSAALGAEDLSASVLLLEERPWDVALLGDTVYFSDGETVHSIGVDGSGRTALFAADSFNFITSVGSDGATVFFSNQDVLTSVPAAGGEPMELGLAGRDSLFGDTAEFARLLPGRGVVYWVDDGSSFGWTALDGQSCGILGRFDSFFDADGYLTESELFVGGDSGLYRVPRVD
jgi:hypothetical protein